MYNGKNIHKPPMWEWFIPIYGNLAVKHIIYTSSKSQKLDD